MNKQQAREILTEGDYSAIQPDNSLRTWGGLYLAWNPGDKDITLDGEATIEELEAIAWWVRNMGSISGSPATSVGRRRRTHSRFRTIVRSDTLIAHVPIGSVITESSYLQIMARFKELQRPLTESETIEILRGS